MSSVVLWQCSMTGVYAEWNKQAPYSVFVPTGMDGCIQLGERTEYHSEKAALRAAKEKAYDVLAERAAAAPVVILKTHCAPVVEEVLSTVPGLRVVVVDADLEGCDSDSIADVENERSWIGRHTAQLEPERVAHIVRQINDQLGAPS